MSRRNTTIQSDCIYPDLRHYTPPPCQTPKPLHFLRSIAKVRHTIYMSDCCQDHNHDHPKPAATNGLANPAVLDALADDKTTGEVVLIMFEPRAWTLGDEQLFQLQEKLNAYMSFALDGELAEQLPQMAGHPIRIQLNCAEPPPEPVVSFLAKVRDQISYQGINFTVEGLATDAGSGGGCGTGCGCH